MAQQLNTVKLTKVQVLFNHNQPMTVGFGNTRKQAERNASINGLRWLKENKLLEENAASCSGVGVHHNPNDSFVPVAFNAQQHIPGIAEEVGGDIEMTNEALSDDEERKF